MEDDWNALNRDWKNDVSSLRLVNTHFASCLQDILFRDITFPLKAAKGSNGLANLMHLSRSEFARFVKSLCFRLSHSHKGSIQGTAKDGDAGQLTQVFFQDLAQCLAISVQAFHNLEYLDMICQDSSFSNQPEELILHQYCQQVDTTIAAILTHIAFDNLKHLTVRVPCTHDFHAILEYDRNGAYSQCRLPLARTISSLRSLSLNICDSSGPYGQRYYYKAPSSLLQTFGSQEQYAQSLFDFASMANNLESLAIRCTVPLNFDLFIPNSLHSLKTFSLTNVKTTGEHLMRCLAQNKSTLEWVSFTQVELMSRTWEDVLVQIYDFPLLLDIAIQSSGYARDGSSSHFGSGLLPPIDDPQSLEGYRLRDRYALGDVTRQVNKRRREQGLREISEYDERSILLPPLCSYDELELT